VLAAEDSSVVPEKNQHSWLPGPEGADTNLLPIAIGEDDLRESTAEGVLHALPILSSARCGVKPPASAADLSYGCLKTSH
jgi:hypothetical protein